MGSVVGVHAGGYLEYTSLLNLYLRQDQFVKHHILECFKRHDVYDLSKSGALFDISQILGGVLDRSLDRDGMNVGPAAGFARYLS